MPSPYNIPYTVIIQNECFARVDETKRHVCTLSPPKRGAQPASQPAFANGAFAIPQEARVYMRIAQIMMLEWRRITQNSRQWHSLGGRDELGAQVLFNLDSFETDTEELSARDLQQNAMQSKKSPANSNLFLLKVKIPMFGGIRDSKILTFRKKQAVCTRIWLKVAGIIKQGWQICTFDNEWRALFF